MNKIKFLSIVFVLLLAAGCAGKQTTFADNMRSGAKEWDKGNALVQSGKEQIKKGEEQQRQADELMSTGKTNVEEGEEKIKDGTFLIETTEREHPESLQR